MKVGVKGVLGGTSVYWYRCTDGLALRIPGFSGSIQCPANIVDWCSSETISGVAYPEVNRALLPPVGDLRCRREHFRALITAPETFEYIMWSGIGAFFVLLFVVWAVGGFRVRLVW